jgi:hypothetical protein
MSAGSQDAPLSVKAQVVFNRFDLDGDAQLSKVWQLEATYK